jgi:prolipoprotein diacylglyceryltransferase
MLVLLYLMKKGKYRERIYPVFMILYGITRFILNWFRHTIKPFLWGIPAGNIWAVVSLCVGIIWITIERRKSK